MANCQNELVTTSTILNDEILTIMDRLEVKKFNDRLFFTFFDDRDLLNVSVDSDERVFINLDL